MLRLRGGAGRSGNGGMLGRGPMAVDSDAGGGRAVGGGEKRVFVMRGFVIGFGHSMLTDVVESYNLDKGVWRKDVQGPAPANLSNCIVADILRVLASTLAHSLAVVDGRFELQPTNNAVRCRPRKQKCMSPPGRRRTYRCNASTWAPSTCTVSDRDMRGPVRTMALHQGRYREH